MTLEDLTSMEKEDISREEWLERRRKVIGASDGPKILGVSKYGDQLSVYMSKILPRQQDDQTESQRWGHLLERAIILSYAEDHPTSAVTYNAKNHMVVSKNMPYVAATLDAVEVRGSEVIPLDAKNVAIQHASQWENGQCPKEYFAQMQHQMYVCEADRGVLAALIGGNTRVDIEVQRDDFFILEIMLPAYAKFWEMVQAKQEPPVEHQLEASRKAYAALHPKENPGATVELPAEIWVMDEKLVALKQQMEELSAEKAMLESKIKAAIGDAEVGLLPWAKYTWKTQHRDAYMVEASDFRVLRRSKRKGK